MVMLAGKWCTANIKCCLRIANGCLTMKYGPTSLHTSGTVSLNMSILDQMNSPKKRQKVKEKTDSL